RSPLSLSARQRNAAKSVYFRFALPPLPSAPIFWLGSPVVARKGADMSTVKLTKRRVDAFEPGAKRAVLWDSEVRGFGLRATPAGERSYVLKYRHRGGQRWFTIGKHGSPWTVETARKEALRLLGEVARGDDPAAAKGADKQALTVAQLCDLYLAEG